VIKILSARLLFTFSHFTVNSLFKILLFFSIWSSHFFFCAIASFFDQIEGQLDKICWLRTKLKDRDQSRKDVINRWWFQSSHKSLQTIHIRSLNVFSIRFWYKNLFLLFLSSWFERRARKRGRHIFAPERENWCWHQFWSSK
jgi:hypothetical protein